MMGTGKWPMDAENASEVRGPRRGRPAGVLLMTSKILCFLRVYLGRAISRTRTRGSQSQLTVSWRAISKNINGHHHRTGHLVAIILNLTTIQLNRTSSEPF